MRKFVLFIMVLGQYPAALQRWKIDALLLAAGLLTCIDELEMTLRNC